MQLDGQPDKDSDQLLKGIVQRILTEVNTNFK